MQRDDTHPPRPISAALAQMLDEHAEGTPPTAGTVPLAHARTLELGGDPQRPDTLRLRGEGGAVELTISIEAHGARVQLVGASLDLVAIRDVELRCASLRVQTELGVAIAASRGDISLDAGDDVVIVGERVLLN